jgi:hypothetical protein
MITVLVVVVGTVIMAPHQRNTVREAHGAPSDETVSNTISGQLESLLGSFPFAEPRETADIDTLIESARGLQAANDARPLEGAHLILAGWVKALAAGARSTGGAELPPLASLLAAMREGANDRAAWRKLASDYEHELLALLGSDMTGIEPSTVVEAISLLRGQPVTDVALQARLCDSSSLHTIHETFLALRLADSAGCRLASLTPQVVDELGSVTLQTCRDQRFGPEQTEPLYVVARLAKHGIAVSGSDCAMDVVESVLLEPTSVWVSSHGGPTLIRVAVETLAYYGRRVRISPEIEQALSRLVDWQGYWKLPDANYSGQPVDAAFAVLALEGFRGGAFEGRSKLVSQLEAQPGPYARLATLMLGSVSAREVHSAIEDNLSASPRSGTVSPVVRLAMLLGLLRTGAPCDGTALTRLAKLEANAWSLEAPVLDRLLKDCGRGSTPQIAKRIPSGLSPVYAAWIRAEELCLGDAVRATPGKPPALSALLPENKASRSRDGVVYPGALEAWMMSRINAIGSNPIGACASLTGGR